MGGPLSGCGVERSQVEGWSWVQATFGIQGWEVSKSSSGHGGGVYAVVVGGVHLATSTLWPNA